MTEDQAKEIRCCGPEGCGQDFDGPRYCIGSACMAWRWIDPATKTESLISRGEAEELGGPNAEPITRDVPFPNRRGFCGLAGKP